MYTSLVEGSPMDMIIPISEARGKLPKLIDQIKKLGKHLVLTVNGRAKAVVLTPEELETLEILADKKLMASLIKGQEDFKAGKIMTHSQVFKNV